MSDAAEGAERRRGTTGSDRLPPHLLHEQAAWLAPARSRLLRRAQIARRSSVLDLGCGPGAVTGELVRRAGGTVAALDVDRRTLTDSAALAGAVRVCGDARRLPFAEETFDLVFCQFVLLWVDVPAAISEIGRVLRPGGALAALEPDYGGLIEHPPEIAARDLWLSALARAGADPQVGRKLPGLLATAGFRVDVDLLDHLEPPSPSRWAFLRTLPLTEEEQREVDRREASEAALGGGFLVVHLPVFLILAEKA